MKRKTNLSRSVLALVLLAVLAMPGLADGPPNIVFIISDDQSYADVGVYGNDEVATPNLDRLAARGGRFTHAYNMGSYSGAVCVASRTMLNSGRFLWHADRLDRTAWQQQGRFWSQQMRERGYRTYFAGKWHVPGTNVRELFDVTGNIRPGMPTDYGRPNAVPEAYERPVEGEAETWDASDPTLGGHFAGGKHWSEVLADDAETMLSDAAEQDRPFFMYLAFNAPHDPRQSPADFVARYPQNEVQVPDNYLPKYPYAEPMGAPHGLRDERLAPWPRTEFAVRKHRQEYYAIITHLDEQVGRILDAVEETGEAENTWIIFTSDHGLAVGHHGLMGKQNMYEHSLRVPFIIAGPGVEANREITTPIYMQDVMATTLEIAGVAAADNVQFRSVLPLLRDERDQQYPAIYGGYYDRQRAVVDGRHKLILYPTIGKLRLFDLVDDPQEMNDLAEDPAQRGRIRELLGQLQSLQKGAGDELDLTAAYGDWF